jgi:nitroreductase
MVHLILELLRNRTSIRKFTGEDISIEIVKYILEAGRLSPSGGNEQSWLFGVINDKDRIKKVSEIAYNQKWIESASFLIVLCTCIVEKERGGRDIQKARFPKFAEEIESIENDIYSRLNMEEHQTKFPGTHMVLAALEHGIASTWISYFDVDKMSLLLDLPKACIASEIIAFGYPTVKKDPLRKKGLEEITFYNVFEK